MRKRVLFTALAGIFLLGDMTARAAAVDTSLRPQLRPGSGAITAAAIVVTDAPLASLRPRARP
ncbi:hypothetical protein, partial [Roseovarius sp. SYSU LYC5161]|uniref:hypothetical protein n=1 Tax=Roseovarius halophilus (ex Wu et al. 2025) TaxID=3376060 RepID=UPI00399A5310